MSHRSISVPTEQQPQQPQQPPLYPWANSQSEAADASIRLANLEKAQRDYRQLGQSIAAAHVDPPFQISYPDKHAVHESVPARLAQLEKDTAHTVAALKSLQAATMGLAETSQRVLEKMATMEMKYTVLVEEQKAAMVVQDDRYNTHAVNIAFLRARTIFIFAWAKSRVTILDRTRRSR